jgi:SAM-dependent methyltransferase
VGADWYEKAKPFRDLEAQQSPHKDWRYLTFLQENLPSGKLLDVGCGNGAFLLMARDRGFDVFGFDYDERTIAIAKQRGLKNVESANFDRYCQERAPGEFSVVTLFDVLEHTPEPARLLGQIKPLIKPGGYLAITLPNELRPLLHGRADYDYPPHHFTRWTPDAMKNFLERNGFSVIRQKADFLGLQYIADSYFFFVVMPPLLGLAKRIIFGRRALTEKTFSDLYGDSHKTQETRLSNKRIRQQIVNGALFFFRVFFSPIWIFLRYRYSRGKSLGGNCLYTLARKNIS